jgi:hypothetical protein
MAVRQSSEMASAMGTSAAARAADTGEPEGKADRVIAWSAMCRCIWSTRQCQGILGSGARSGRVATLRGRCGSCADREVLRRGGVSKSPTISVRAVFGEFAVHTTPNSPTATTGC